jgi:predicted adenine nucleotide alpha hydrolase (AANH) superfamily ATPase
MGEDVKKYIQEGIHFSNEFMDMIEDISRKYQEHISVSMEIGHFDKMGKIMMKLSEALIVYNQQYSGLIRDYREERVLENEKKGLETIIEE